MTEFKPPIPQRTTKQLLQIAGSPHKWNPEALKQAQLELEKRNVPEKEIKMAAYLSQRIDQFEELKKAKESYSICDSIDSPFETFFEILVYWELEKDGYLRKAEQQRILRPVLIGIILLVITILTVFL